MSRLIDHFPSWMTGGGIFNGMTGMPWNALDSGIAGSDMDIEYFGNHSGLRQSSPIIEKMTSFPEDHELSAAEIALLQRLIKQKFAKNWQRIYDALLVEYEPLNNYDMYEKRTPGAVKTVAVNTDEKITNKSDGSLYGFNSSTPVPASKAEGTSQTEGLKTKNYSEESYTGYDELERSGNIGVTTNAQMLSGEIEVRKNMFLEIVYQDVDTILTRPSW